MSARILIVDDMEFNLEITSRILSVKGFDVIVAHDGMEAVEIAKAEQPDLILMDIGLPDISGWEAADILKSDKLTKAIPVIALTAHDGQGYKDKSKHNGFAGYATKPVDYENLVEQIYAVLNRTEH